MAQFRSIVRGLTRLPARDDGTGSSAIIITLDDMAGNGTRNCAGWEGELVVCPGPDSGAATFTAPLASIPYNTSADLFAVTAFINGPSLGGADCHTPLSPADFVCAGGGEAMYDGVIGGSYVRGAMLGEAAYPDPGYVAVASEYHADNTVPPSGTVAHTAWPDDELNRDDIVGVTGCFLVNGAPTWPVPDVIGNVFGMVLFTHAQLPAAIETIINYFSYDNPIAGQLHVGVLAYNINTPPGLLLHVPADVIGHV